MSFCKFFSIIFAILIFSLVTLAQDNIRLLEPDKPIERELKGGENHVYRITMAAGQFLYVVAEQKGVDVVVTLFAPDGKKLLEVDSPNGTRAEESLWFISGESGDYRLVVTSVQTDSPAGQYQVKIVELRTSDPTAENFVAAGKSMAKADLLAAQTTDESSVQAIEGYRAVADLFRQSGDKKDQARALYKIGRIYQYKRETDLAIDYYEQAYKLFEAVNSTREKAVALRKLGDIHSDKFDFQTAVDYYQRALTITDSVNDKRDLVALRNALGLAEVSLGNFDQALNNYFKGLEISIEINYINGIGTILNNIGLIYGEQGNYARALEFQERQLSLAKTTGREASMPHILLNIGIIHQAQGNFTVSLDYAEKAFQGYEKFKSTDGMSMALNNIGVIYLDQREFEKALDYFDRSVRIKNEKENLDPINLENIGLVYKGLGNYDKALEYLQKAVDISTGTDAATTATSTLDMAETFAAQGNHKKSLEFALRSIELARPLGLRKVLSMAYTAAGKANLSLGRTRDAQQNFSDAILMNENLRLQVTGGTGQQTAFFEQYLSPYYLMVELLVSGKNSYEAFHLAERTKARTLLDVLQTGKTDFSKEMTVAEREEDRSLKSAMVSLNAQVSVEKERPEREKTRLADLQNKLEIKRLEFEYFQTRLYAAHPELRIQRGEMTPISVEESAGLLPDDKGALLEYVGAEDKTFLFVLAREGKSSPVSMKVYPIEVKQKDLAERGSIKSCGNGKKVKIAYPCFDQKT